MAIKKVLARTSKVEESKVPFCYVFDRKLLVAKLGTKIVDRQGSDRHGTLEMDRFWVQTGWYMVKSDTNTNIFIFADI